MVSHNIAELRQIKEYYARIVAKETKFLEELLQLPPTPVMYMPAQPIDAPLVLNEESAAALFRQNIALLLAHTGFDG